ncbi:hypothetical protein ACFW6V_07630 [Streptomyces sp. NPDC058734]|uniref:hypothetical protein n=1 Tax=Streptomyces sp. NPDC058734 TaxID=3346615 RepID=UPI0036AB5607
MSVTTQLRRLSRVAVAGGAAFGLALTLAAPAAPAAAEPAAPRPVPQGARILALELKAPNLTITFQDLNADSIWHKLVLTPAGRSPTFELGVPGEGRVLTQTFDAGLLPGKGYCAHIWTRAPYGKVKPINYDYYSEEKCAQPIGSAQNPSDVAVGSIEGDSAPPPGSTRTYWINYSNRGAEAKDITIEAQPTGTMTMRRPPDSGTFTGFQCAPAGAGFRCTGGSLPNGGKAQIPFLGKVTTSGPGAIHVTISVAGDSNPTNNQQTLTTLSAP